MALTDFLVARVAPYDPEADPMANPLPEEAADLPLHVNMCARRYGALMRVITEMRTDNRDVKVFIVKTMITGLAAFAAIINGGAIISALLKGH